MKITYYHYAERNIPPEQLILLYKDAGWWEERQEQDIFRMLESGPSIGAWHDNTLIGFIRAVSDGCFRAYIEDVVVRRDHQRRGIGEELVAMMLRQLQQIDVISLFCEEPLIDFYQAQGFKRSRSQYVLHRKG